MYCSLRLFATVPRGLPYAAPTAEDAVRLLRWLARPLLFAVVISLMAVGLLFAMQQSMSLVGSTPSLKLQLTVESPDRARQERDLDAEVNAYLAALEATHHQGDPYSMP